MGADKEEHLAGGTDKLVEQGRAQEVHDSVETGRAGVLQGGRHLSEVLSQQH